MVDEKREADRGAYLEGEITPAKAPKKDADQDPQSGDNEEVD